MKPRYLALAVTAVCIFVNIAMFAGKSDVPREPAPPEPARKADLKEPPAFFKGIYLNSHHGGTRTLLEKHVAEAARHGINAIVLDMQDSVVFRPSIPPAAHVQLCLSNGLWPIARIVVFPYGLKEYPVPAAHIESRMVLARKAAALGFREVQFDYIRFEDSGRLRHVPREQRFAVVEGFLRTARAELSRSGVYTSADIFGRIPLNQNDPIGQRMEGLDEVVDFILPMAYPSHYDWSRYLMANPYFTVYDTAVKGNARLKKAQQVMYIQGFEMRIRHSGLTLPVYIAHQIKACHDAGTRGYIVWNADQRYGPTYAGMRLHYSGQTLPGRISREPEAAGRPAARRTTAAVTGRPAAAASN
jgi:hypothetical protein